MVVGFNRMRVDSAQSLPQAEPIALHPAFRKPKRMTITLPERIYLQLVQRSDREGRSLSNLAAYLLESSL